MTCDAFNVSDVRAANKSLCLFYPAWLLLSPEECCFGFGFSVADLVAVLSRESSEILNVINVLGQNFPAASPGHLVPAECGLKTHQKYFAIYFFLFPLNGLRVRAFGTQG